MDTASARALALFDFDGTLIRGDSIVSFIRLARRLNALSRGEYAAICLSSLGYLLHFLSADRAKTRALRFLSRLSPERKTALETAFALEQLLPAVYPEAKAEIARCKEEGKILLLISASTENYMQHIASALGFDALICTPVAKDGTVGPNCRGEEKKKRLDAWLKDNGITPDWPASSAYGDSFGDLPLLRLAGHPVLINPKKKLRRAAPQMPLKKWGKRRRAKWEKRRRAGS